MSGADLRGSRLWFTEFVRTDVRKANFSGATIGRAKFGDIDVSVTCGFDSMLHVAPSTIGIDTIYRSHGKIAPAVLRSFGIPEAFITNMKALVSALEPIEFYSCFISYGHSDKAFARLLHDRLQSCGIRCWLDEKQVVPGDRLYDQIDRGIRLWDKFLLCCSEHSLQPTSWVDKEIISALEKEDELTMKRGQRVHALIPLNLDNYLFTEQWKSGYRAEIRSRLAADFTGWETRPEKFEREIERLIHALRSDEAAREQPPISKM